MRVRGPPPPGERVLAPSPESVSSEAPSDRRVSLCRSSFKDPRTAQRRTALESRMAGGCTSTTPAMSPPRTNDGDAARIARTRSPDGEIPRTVPVHQRWTARINVPVAGRNPRAERVAITRSGSSERKDEPQPWQGCRAGVPACRRACCRASVNLRPCGSFFSFGAWRSHAPSTEAKCIQGFSGEYLPEYI